MQRNLHLYVFALGRSATQCTAAYALRRALGPGLGNHAVYHDEWDRVMSNPQSRSQRRRNRNWKRFRVSRRSTGQPGGDPACGRVFSRCHSAVPP
jgi:hypothetical protein